MSYAYGNNNYAKNWIAGGVGQRANLSCIMSNFDRPKPDADHIPNRLNLVTHVIRQNKEIALLYK